MNTVNRNMVKASPVSRVFSFLILLWLCWLVLGIVEVVLSRGRTITGFVFIVCGSLMILLYFLQRLRPNKFEQRRQRAASGDQSLLAQEQVIPDATALALPTIIKLCPRWHSIFLLTAIVFVLLVLILVVPVMLIDGGLRALSSHQFLIFLAIDSPVVLIPTLLVPLLFLLGRKNRIEVSESGLTTRSVQGVHYVPWNEAQLFAIYFGKNGRSAMIYELSSAKDIVHWTWLRKYSKFSAQVPCIPVDEYNRQMLGLLSFIAAKTRLPLYDLRQR